MKPFPKWQPLKYVAPDGRVIAEIEYVSPDSVPDEWEAPRCYHARYFKEQTTYGEEFESMTDAIEFIERHTA